MKKKSAVAWVFAQITGINQSAVIVIKHPDRGPVGRSLVIGNGFDSIEARWFFGWKKCKGHQKTNSGDSPGLHGYIPDLFSHHLLLRVYAFHQ